ncbi:hypothetical protein [[Acholeplasma] multilocale]|uniref:hypothetical protein n=1 Tax=[Acholeplasma] multilocale TaxID=264638 RepID=UPI00047EA79C|nr:hypothetical protein [[Acholeplasma] multilocale]
MRKILVLGNGFDIKIKNDELTMEGIFKDFYESKYLNEWLDVFNKNSFEKALLISVLEDHKKPGFSNSYINKGVEEFPAFLLSLCKDKWFIQSKTKLEANSIMNLKENIKNYIMFILDMKISNVYKTIQDLENNKSILFKLIKSKLESYDVVLTFNYSNTIEMFGLNGVIHLHGAISENEDIYSKYDECLIEIDERKKEIKLKSYMAQLSHDEKHVIDIFGLSFNHDNEVLEILINESPKNTEINYFGYDYQDDIYIVLEHFKNKFKNVQREFKALKKGLVEEFDVQLSSAFRNCTNWINSYLIQIGTENILWRMDMNNYNPYWKEIIEAEEFTEDKIIFNLYNSVEFFK